MAESILIGAGVGAGTSMLTGNDPLKGAALGGAMGGVGSQLTSNPLTQEAVGSTVTNGVQNPALTNSIGQSSNPLTQFGRDASDAFSNVGDTIGQGFDYINDKTGMENKDWTQMGLNQGAQLMQPEPQQPIQAAPMGQGISRPNVDLSKTAGSLLTSNPLLQDELRRQGLL
jgi:hypothetical protein